MDSNGGLSFRHRHSPSSNRFLGVFSPPQSDNTSIGCPSLTGDELNEDEVFWTGDFAQSNRRSSSSYGIAGYENNQRQAFRRPEKFGILAALPENNRRPNRPLLYRNPSISSSSASSTTTSPMRMIPAIPKRPQEGECFQSVPARKFHQSAPVNVPVFSKKVMSGELAEVDVGDEEDYEMLPPHEIVARGSAKSPKTTFSVLEGVGRTLKGRDLRQVRNAVWNRTGFLD